VLSNYLANHLFLFGHLELALLLSVCEAFQPKHLETAHGGAALTQLGGEPHEVNVKKYIYKLKTHGLQSKLQKHTRVLPPPTPDSQRRRSHLWVRSCPAAGWVPSPRRRGGPVVTPRRGAAQPCGSSPCPTVNQPQESIQGINSLFSFSVFWAGEGYF